MSGTGVPSEATQTTTRSTARTDTPGTETSSPETTPTFTSGGDDDDANNTGGSSSSSLSPGTIGGIVGGILGGLALLALASFWYLRRMRTDFNRKLAAATTPQMQGPGPAQQPWLTGQTQFQAPYEREQRLDVASNDVRPLVAEADGQLVNRTPELEGGR